MDYVEYEVSDDGYDSGDSIIDVIDEEDEDEEIETIKFYKVHNFNCVLSSSNVENTTIELLHPKYDNEIHIPHHIANKYTIRDNIDLINLIMTHCIDEKDLTILSYIFDDKYKLCALSILENDDCIDIVEMIRTRDLKIMSVDISQI